MHDARDAEDSRLLDANDHTTLLATYYPVILERCRVRLRDPDAWEVAHAVVDRLLRELSRGKRYPVPFRVVVHKVIGWKINEHFAPAKAQEVELEEWLKEASTDSATELERDSGFEVFLEGLTELEQEVVRLRYLEDLDFQEIATRLGKAPNAVHQIHHRALTKLRRDAA